MCHMVGSTETGNHVQQKEILVTVLRIEAEKIINRNLQLDDEISNIEALKNNLPNWLWLSFFRISPISLTKENLSA